MAKVIKPGNVRYGILEVNDDLTPQDLFEDSLQQEEVESGLGSFTSDIDISKFKNISNLYLTGNLSEDRRRLEETRALSQSNLGLAAKGLGNVVSTLVSETLKIPGYLGGFATDLFSGNVFQGDFSNTIDNFWINGINWAKENTTDEILKVYTPPSLQEGSLTEQLSNPYFWAKEGADGVGFLLSFLLPGQAVKALGLGGKTVKLLSKTGLATNFDEIAKNVDSTSAVFINTLLESAAEGSNAYDNLIQQGKSPEEAGRLASDVLKKNIGVLAISNLFVERYLLNGFGRLQGKKGIARLTDEVIKGTEEVQKYTTKQLLGKSVSKVPTSILQEGFFEEGLQTTIEQVSTQTASWKDVMEKYYNNISNMLYGTDEDATAFGKAVVLGGILGGAAGGVSSVAEAKAEDRLLLGQQKRKVNTFQKWLNFKDRESKEGLLSVFRSAYSQIGKSAEDLFNYDENGNIAGLKPNIDEKLQTEIGMTSLFNFYNDLIYKFDGDVELAKRAFVNQLGEKTNLLNIFKVAEGLSNPEVIEQINNRQDLNYFSRFFELEGGKELLNSHINTIADKIAERYKQNTGQDYGDKSKLIKDLKEKSDKYFDLNNRSIKEVSILRYVVNPFKDTDSVEIREKKKILFPEYLKQVQREITASLTNIYHAEKRIEELTNELNNIESKAMNKGFADTTRKGSSQDNIKDFLNTPDYKEYNRLKKDINTYNNIIKEEGIVYSELTEQKKLEENWNRAFDNQKELEKKVDREENETASKVKEFQEKASEYGQDEPVIVEDKDGKRHELTSASPEAPIVATPKDVKDVEDFYEIQKAIKEYQSQKELIEKTHAKVITKEQLKKEAQQELESQIIPDTEPDENNYDPSNQFADTDPFYNHALADVPWRSRGISVAYRQDGYDETITTEEGNLIPVANNSVYQQNWFYYTDDVDIDKSQHKLILINPKYDNSNQYETILSGMVPEDKRSSDDIFIFITDKAGNLIQYNGTPLVNSLGKIESMFPINADPKVNWFSMFNMYLQNNFNVSLDRKTFASNKKGVFPALDRINKKMDSDISSLTTQQIIEQLKPLVRDYVEGIYQSEYIQPVLDNYLMESNIEGITNGFPVKIFDKDGNVKLYNVKDSFNLKIVDGKGQNFKLAISDTKGNVLYRPGFIPGIVYIVRKDQIAPLKMHKLNENEVNIVINVLAYLADKPNLDIVVSDKNLQAEGLGNMSINNITYGYGKESNPIRIFPKGRNRFSLMTMLVNWGTKKGSKSNKNIYIEKGEVKFGDKSISLQFIKDNINNPKALVDLELFLRDKLFHINRQLLENNKTNQPYYHPSEFKDGKIIFKKYNSYLDFVLTRLNTDIAPKEYYRQFNLPQFAQRNINITKPVQTDISAVVKKTVEEINQTRKRRMIADDDIIAKDKKMSTSEILEDMINKKEIRKIC